MNKIFNFEYDKKEILRIAKKRLAVTVLLTVVSILLITFSILGIAFYGERLVIFLLSVASALIGFSILAKQSKKLSKISFFSSDGEISNIELDVRGVNEMKTASYAITRPKYSKYWRDEIRCRVYIEESKKTRSYKLNNITKKQADYYERKGSAIHLFATRYPIKTIDEYGEWLCPLCGEFNEKSQTHCNRCKNKIMTSKIL